MICIMVIVISLETFLGLFISVIVIDILRSLMKFANNLQKEPLKDES